MARNKKEVTPSENTLVDALENKETVDSKETLPLDNAQPEKIKDIKTEGVSKEIQDLLGGYKETLQVEEQPEQPQSKRGRKSKKQEPESAPEMPSLISGALLVLMIDLIIPNIIAFANNKITNEKITAKSLQLTTAQKNELQPVADEVAKTIALQANPLTVLIVTLLGIYGVNLMALKSK